MDNHSRGLISRVKSFGWLLSLAALFFLGRWLWHTDRRIWSSLWHWRLWWLLASLLMLQAWFLVRFWLWHTISRRHGYNQTQRHNLRMWTLSELTRYIPGNIWSFATRYQGSVRGGSQQSEAIQAIVLENLGLVGGAVLLVSLLSQNWLWIFIGLGLCLVYILAVPRIVPLIWKKLRPQEYFLVLRWSKLSLLLLGYSVSWLIFGLAIVFLYRAWPSAPALGSVKLIWVSVAAWLVGYITIVTPSGLGARELAFVSLSRDVLSSGFSSFFAVVSRVWLILSELVFLGLVILFGKKS